MTFLQLLYKYFNIVVNDSIKLHLINAVYRTDTGFKQ